MAHFEIERKDRERDEAERKMKRKLLAAHGGPSIPVVVYSPPE